MNGLDWLCHVKIRFKSAKVSRALTFALARLSCYT